MEKLNLLKQRLIKVQRELIGIAAKSSTIPSDNALRKIADLEIAIAAVEAMIDEGRRT